MVMVLKQYQYTSLDRSQQKISGMIEADNEKSAVFQLEKQGLTPLTVTRVNAQENKKPVGRKPKDLDILLFIERLVTMLSSGISLHAGLTALSRGASNSYLAKEISEMVKNLDQGVSFSVTLEQSRLELPSYVIQLLRSGEYTGQLTESLAGIAEQLRYDLRVKKEFSQALTYPVILIVAGMLAIGIIFVMVVPKFANLLDKVDDLPFLAWAVLNTGVFFNEWKTVILSVMAVAFVSIVLLFRLPDTKRVVMNMLFLTPGIGKLLSLNQIARWTGMMSILLSNKIPILDALALANKAVEIGMLRARFGLVSDKLRDGGMLADALSEAHLMSAVGIDLIDVGEKTGKLAEMLSSISSLYAEEMRDAVKKLLSMVEPLSILVIGLVVGLIMTGVILAITSLNQAVV